jgi:hypothetical protein
MQAQMFREQVEAVKAGRQSRDEIAAELANLRKEEKSSHKAAKHVGFGAFLKGYKSQDDSKHSHATRTADVHVPVKAEASLAVAPHPDKVKVPADHKDKGKHRSNGSREGKSGSSEGTRSEGGDMEQAYKKAVRDVIKEELVVALKQGTISREQFKDIARRATEKVVSLTAVRVVPLFQCCLILILELCSTVIASCLMLPTIWMWCGS